MFTPKRDDGLEPDSIGAIARQSAERTGRKGKHAPTTVGLPRIPVYDNGGDVSIAASKRLQASGDAGLQSILNSPDEQPLIPSKSTNPTEKAQPTLTDELIPLAREQYAEHKVTAKEDAPQAKPTYMPGSGSVEAAPTMPRIAVDLSKAPVYDDGGDVDVNDGKHQVAVLQDGEKVLAPEEAAQYKAEHGETKQQPASEAVGQPAVGRSVSKPTDLAPLIPTEEAKAPEEKATQGQVLGQEWLKRIGVKPAEPSTSNITESSSLPKIALPKEEHQETVGGPLISGASSTETPSEQRDLRNMERRAQTDSLEQQRQKALAQGDLATADRLAVAKSELQKTPWSDRGTLSKFGKIASTVGNIAGDIVSPNVMALIPGTDLNRALKERSAFNRITPETEADVREAQAANARAEVNAGPAEKPAEYEIKTDDQGRMWRVDKLSKQPPQLITFDKSGAPTLTGAPAGEQPTFGKKTEKGMDAPANETQQSEFTTQLATIAPALSPEQRNTFAFPKGYTPTLKEIEENKKLLREANESKLAGKREDLANQTAQAALNKRSLEEKVIEQIAKDIAPMDIDSLSKLKDITSMRSDQRSLIYARAKELNPEFNTAEVDRKVKMLDNFTNGKDAQNIQSFGTFFEHAGNASHIVNDLRNGVTPKVVNVALNKLESEGWGTTAVQLSAALEPVRKEFEGFLLGGRALYADDRKAAETILSDSSTPAQIQAALKVMAHTAGARYNEMNNRFKNTMKVDLSESVGGLPDEAYNGAEAVGITELGGKTLRDGKHGYGWYKTSAEEK